jgi:hypothetical protein
VNRTTSITRAGASLAVLGSLLVGLGVGTTVATTRSVGAAGGAGSSLPAPSQLVDLTRHSTTLIDGVPGSRGSVEVACPTGVVIGGGFSHVSHGLRVTASRPDGIRAWKVSWAQTSMDDTALYAYAICLTDGSA